MQIGPLDEKDLNHRIAQHVHTIWHRDPYISEELANIGRKRYLENAVKVGDSCIAREGDEVLGFVIGTIPEWDSEFFGFDSFIIRDMYYSDTKTLAGLIDYVNGLIHENGIRYAYAKIPADDVTAIRALENEGFTVSDIRITFNRKLKDEKRVPFTSGRFTYDIAKEGDIESIAQISKEVSKVDRFHRDPNFPKDKANGVYFNWVISGAKTGKDIVKCMAGDKIIGFHMSYTETSLESESQSPLSISDLMGVLPEYGGKGIGTGLYEGYFGFAEKKRCQSVIAGVHIDNIPSMRLHERVGFRAIHTEVGLGRWY